MSLLERIKGPHDVKSLRVDELPMLADEVRKVITDTVFKTGGHLGSNLGVVDLTLALHHVFDVEKDLIVWDGTYQTYTHKLLTGRFERFSTLRQFGGVCGFGWKPESPYDPFNFGHVGGALAVALGACVGDERAERKRKVVSIIGDGAMTSGIALEALNNIGASKRDILVILNDNGWSISPTVGALSKYFTELRSAPLYDEVKKEIHRLLSRLPGGPSVEAALDSMRRGLKETIFPNIFSVLGLQYYGPVDGHDVRTLIRILQNVRHQAKPVLLHVVTEKGRGHPQAKTDPFALHKPPDVKPGFVKTALEAKLEPGGKPAPAYAKSYTRAFVDSMISLAASDRRIVGITAAMPDGTGLLEFGKLYPDRLFDVGIAEQMAVGLAAGLAHAGQRPIVAIYSSFFQRAYDIVFQEACLNNLPVIFLLDRAGVAGEDGPTHHGNFDIAFLRAFPNMTLVAPKDEAELHAMMSFCVAHPGPIALRIPREGTPDLSRFKLPTRPIELGKGELLADGRDGAILAYGCMTAKALAAREMLLKEGIDVAVANGRFAKPVDAELATRLTQTYPFVITVEDHAALGGFGSAVLEALSLRGEDTRKVKVHAIPDAFLQHADRSELLKFLHLDAEGIADVVRMTAAGHPTPALDDELKRNMFYRG
ncbi:MAG: 1-deoxy-D-xylulose-5-phosphate synthase [Planctomycetes bacterium]|nr:1-deoxy-D-xylulose-5-phosphate synthase [Planctomycetota bacterium]